MCTALAKSMTKSMDMILFDLEVRIMIGFSDQAQEAYGGMGHKNSRRKYFLVYSSLLKLRPSR